MKMSEPRSWCLLQTIKRALQQTYMIRMISISVTRWLSHVDSLSKILVQKSIMDIQLAQNPTTRKSQRQKNPYSGWFKNRVERIKEILTYNLVEPLRYQPCLMPFDGTICLPLGTKHPLTTYRETPTPRSLGVACRLGRTRLSS